MTYEMMVRKIRTAGSAFVGSFLEEILRRYPSYADDADKKQAFFFEYMHSEYGEAMGYEYDTTKTKCYAIISIIEGGRVLDAIEYVINGDDKRVPDYAKENAGLLLDAIARDEVKLPYGR